MGRRDLFPAAGREGDGAAAPTDRTATPGRDDPGGSLDDLWGGADPAPRSDPEGGERGTARRGPRVGRWWVRYEWPLYLVSAVVTALVATRAMHLTSADLTIPFLYTTDATAVLAHFKTVLETGWYEYQPALGAPFGQQYHDFPQADNLHMMAATVIGLFTGSAPVAVNVYYLMGFPLAALTSVWFFRRVGVSKALSLVLSVLFAIAPFHWEKGENHLFLAAYFPVPLALVVVLWAVRGEPVWGLAAPPRTAQSGGPDRGVRRLRAVFAGRGAATLAILALLGTASSYFSVFLLLMLATAAVVAFARTRSWTRLAGVIGAAITLALVMLANMLPDILYSIVNGNNISSLVRDDSESERFALKIVQLILPAPDHQLAPFRQLRKWYDTTYPFVSERPALGLIAAVGFIGLLAHIVLRLGGAGPLPDSRRRHHETLGYLALLTLVALLFSTLGGFETIISFFTDSLRSWNRMSILIMAFTLAAVGLTVDRMLRGAVRRRMLTAGPSRTLTATVAGLLLVIGVWDQSTLRAIPSYASVQSEWNADQQWIGRLEGTLPAGSMVFQLPYQAFPETPSLNGVVYTDALKPYLHSRTLRWSGGGLRGRADADWNVLVAAERAPRMVADLAVAGFAGIMIDRRSYVDAGAAIELALSQALGRSSADLVSANSRYAFFSLAGEYARLAALHTPRELAYAGMTVTQPVVLYPTDGFAVGLNASKQTLWTSRGPRQSLILDNARGGATQIRMHMVLNSPTFTTQVMLTSGRQSWVVNLSPGIASAITLEFTAPPGRTDFVVSPGPDAVNAGPDSTFGIADIVIDDVSRPDFSLPCVFDKLGALSSTCVE